MADVLHSIMSYRTGRRQNLLSSQRAIEKGPAGLALYSLTGRANSPFHAEPAQVQVRER